VQPAHHLATSGIHQARELVEVVIHVYRVFRSLTRGPDQERSLDRDLDINELADARSSLST
jgi:hypothetical protein